MNAALDIVRIAKSDRARAEELALALIQSVAPQLGALSVKINESKLSLNSVNGYIMSGTKKYFFKFHAEENETESLEKTEYYNAKILAEFGWPAVQPVFTSHKPGLQFVIYEYIDAPTAFDAYEEQELRRLKGGSYDDTRVLQLLDAERSLCEKIRNGFLNSLEQTEESEVEKASLNQLFFKRLVGTSENPPRLEMYYLDKMLKLPDGDSLPFNELLKMRWVINGINYDETLAEIIAKAKELLNPAKEKGAATVIGHGDDHNGNRFIINGDYVFFDMAVAGRQPALLSFIKATAHNIFLHPFWLYEPKKLEGRLQLQMNIRDNVISVQHNWSLPELSPLRLKILKLYEIEVWRPLLQELAKRGWLPPYWKEYIRAGLFCCPFLVLNLIDKNKYSPAQSVLALAKCVELGSRSKQENLAEQFLTNISPQSV